MPATVKAVANRFLELAESEGKTIDPLKMQKLIYVADGWALAITGEPLFSEAVEAWDYGPVVASLYHDLKMYGAGPIKKRLHAYDFEADRVIPATWPFSDIQNQIMQEVWRSYGKLSGPQLIELTHKPGSPWQNARMNNRGESNARIDRAKIREWFTRQILSSDGVQSR